MPIELLNNDHMTAFKNATNNTKCHVKIVSPFIGFETSKQLVLALKDSQAECTIITRFYREDFLNHASSLEGLKILVNAGFKVYALKNLYSKLYIFDNELAILGLTNYMMGGFRFQHELALFVREEYELITQLNCYFDDLLRQIKASGKWMIDAIRIENEIKLVNKLSKNRKDKNTRYSNIAQFGIALAKQGTISEIDEIEKMMRENINSHFTQGIWLQFINTGINKYNPDDKYQPQNVMDNKVMTSFSQEPSHIADGDYIYLSVNSWDKNKTATPMIVGRARCQNVKIDNNSTSDAFKQYTWMSDYPYILELYDIEVLDAKISTTIPLDRLIGELGCDLYQTTQGKELGIAELNQTHLQKSHLELTPSAKQYIDKLFNDIKKTNGLIDFSSINAEEQRDSSIA